MAQGWQGQDAAGAELYSHVLDGTVFSRLNSWNLSVI